MISIRDRAIITAQAFDLYTSRSLSTTDFRTLANYIELAISTAIEQERQSVDSTLQQYAEWYGTQPKSVSQVVTELEKILRSNRV